MIRNGFRLVIGALLAAAVAAPALAHHSFRSQYDSNQPITLTGVVTKIEWLNPHVYFYIDVTNEETGEIENWAFEMGPPHMLQRRGWKRNSMNIGDIVQVEGTRARDGSLTANARRVMMTATGQVLGAASSEGQTITGN
ncbi:MAG TPA: DUF6152 family protein [Gammaproteobacteria bacterium]